MKPKITIAIRIENCTKKQIISWAQPVIGPLEISKEIPNTTFYKNFNENRTVLSLTELGFQCFDTDFFFYTANTPWKTAVDCARDAVRKVRSSSITVYCDPGNSFPGVDSFSNTMFKINNQGELLSVLVLSSAGQ